MSTNLYWRIIPDKAKDQPLSKEMKEVLGMRFWGNKTFSGDNLQPIILGYDQTQYLLGLRDGNFSNSKIHQDAEHLLDAIAKYGEIEILIHQ